MRGLLKSVYQEIYQVLPPRGKVLASDLVFSLTGKPHVYFDHGVHPAQRLRRGAVVFSVDFELAWAWRYARKLSNDCVVIGMRERHQVPQILDRMEEYGVPATWATVGHLFLERCERAANGSAHPDMSRPEHFRNAHWEFTEGDWYQHDPCSDVRRAPAWYAADLIEKILASTVKHEMASHGFSHVGFGSYCPAEVASAELQASIDAMESFGVTPRTFVFPGNEAGHYGLLAHKGFHIVRSFPVNWAEISLPLKSEEGLWQVHDSVAVDLEWNGSNLEKRLFQLKKYVDKAAEHRLAAHIWFHPSLPPDQTQEVLFPLFRYCAEQREKGNVDVLTMAQLVEATEDAKVRQIGI